MDDERRQAPSHVQALAERRAQARRERDWGTADALKAELEAAGWKVVDRGHRYRLQPAHAPNVESDGVVRYGSSAGVPSRLEEPHAVAATIVVVAGTELPARLPSAPQLVVVLTDPHVLLPAKPAEAEVVLAAAPLGLVAAWNMGLRRAIGSIIVLLAPGMEPRADVVGQVTAALADEDVALVGWPGLSSTDLRHWHSAPAGDVDALGAGVVAFRRTDARLRGPLDERFSTPKRLAIWWSLMLRDAGPDGPPRRALALDLTSPRTSDAPESKEQPEILDRAARRDFYRLLDTFGRRYDLLRGPVRPTAASAKARSQRR